MGFIGALYLFICGLLRDKDCVPSHYETKK
jgi:hypothetical protein